MRIGLDLDGCVIDSEKTFRVYGEIYGVDVINKKIAHPEEGKHFKRYDLTDEEDKYFLYNYILNAAKESNLMPGFLPVYKRLKEQGHEFIVITARGGLLPEMKDNALEVLRNNNIDVDGFYYNVHDKLEICKQENIDVMIDDDYHIIEKISASKIKTLYFRDTNLKKLEENEYIREVNNWGDVYRYFHEVEKNK